MKYPKKMTFIYLISINIMVILAREKNIKTDSPEFFESQDKKRTLDQKDYYTKSSTIQSINTNYYIPDSDEDISLGLNSSLSMDGTFTNPKVKISVKISPENITNKNIFFKYEKYVNESNSWIVIEDKSSKDEINDEPLLPLEIGESENYYIKYRISSYEGNGDDSSFLSSNIAQIDAIKYKEKKETIIKKKKIPLWFIITTSSGCLLIIILIIVLICCLKQKKNNKIEEEPIKKFEQNESEDPMFNPIVKKEDIALANSKRTKEVEKIN